MQHVDEIVWLICKHDGDETSPQTVWWFGASCTCDRANADIQRTIRNRTNMVQRCVTCHSAMRIAFSDHLLLAQCLLSSDRPLLAIVFVCNCHPLLVACMLSSGHPLYRIL